MLTPRCRSVAASGSSVAAALVILVAYETVFHVTLPTMVALG